MKRPGIPGATSGCSTSALSQSESALSSGPGLRRETTGAGAQHPQWRLTATGPRNDVPDVLGDHAPVLLTRPRRDLLGRDLCLYGGAALNHLEEQLSD